MWVDIVIEPVHEITDNLGFRPGQTQTGLYSHRRWIEAGNFGLRKRRNCTIRVAKTKALISFAVTAKLICVFVFVYSDCWFLPCIGSVIIDYVTRTQITKFSDIKSQIISFSSKKREVVPDLAPMLWHSFGTVAALLQEIVNVYPAINPPHLTVSVILHHHLHLTMYIQNFRPGVSNSKAS